MITLNFTCPRCGGENNAQGASRFLDSSKTAVVRLDRALCIPCYVTVRLAQDHLRRIGQWIDGEWR